jgi:hypothetical protein
MENNFYSTLLNLVTSNKDKFLGLLRRNGVLVNPKISSESLTNTIISAMTKSESFKREVVLLMTVLISDVKDDNFANTNGTFSTLSPISPTLGYTNKYIPQTTNETTSTTTTTTTQPAKAFGDTTVGKITDGLFSAFDKYLQSQQIKVREKEASAGQSIKADEVRLAELEKDKDKTGLYVGLAIGGVAVVGLLVYLIAKKN